MGRGEWKRPEMLTRTTSHLSFLCSTVLHRIENDHKLNKDPPSLRQPRTSKSESEYLVMKYWRTQNLNNWFKDFCCKIITSDTEFLPQTYTVEGKIALCSAVCCREGGRKARKTYPSYFRTITQLSLHTLHTAVTESVQGGSGPLLKNTHSHEMFYFWREAKTCGTILKKMRRYKRGQIHVTEWTMSGFEGCSSETDFFPLFGSFLHHHRFRCWSQMRTIVSQNFSSPSTAWTAFLRQWRQPRPFCRVRRWHPKRKGKKKPQTKPVFHYHYC